MNARRSKRLKSLLFWGFFVCLALFLWPPSLGGYNGGIIVRGESMLPVYEPGDVIIISKWGKPYQVGDIIAFDQNLNNSDIKIIHRIIETKSGGQYKTQGDNNPIEDPFIVLEDSIGGKALLRIPHAGRFLEIFINPIVTGSLLLMGLVLYNWQFLVGGTKNEEDYTNDTSSSAAAAGS